MKHRIPLLIISAIAFISQTVSALTCSIPAGSPSRILWDTVPLVSIAIAIAFIGKTIRDPRLTFIDWLVDITQLIVAIGLLGIVIGIWFSIGC
jgi:hypothetical protein